jgi:hypothetical protein
MGATAFYAHGYSLNKLPVLSTEGPSVLVLEVRVSEEDVLVLREAVTAAEHQ